VRTILNRTVRPIGVGVLSSALLMLTAARLAAQRVETEDGVLLGEFPLTHFVDAIRVFGDRLFLIDRERGVSIYQYRIVEK
jgi:hypothetical protein